MKSLLRAFVAAAALSGLGLAGLCGEAPFGNGKILCTTFPVYLLTRNVAQGREGVSVELMIPAGTGCPHDYALTPQDMRKLSEAGVLVVNGLGMEEFLGAPLKRANPKVKIIDSSKGIEGILEMDEDEGHAEGESHKGEEKDRHHHHDGPNPHLFASPRMAAKMAINIAEGLAKANPEGAKAYMANANAYARKLDSLADEFAKTGKTLVNNRIVTQHGVFDYLARDAGLEIVAVVEAHPGQEPSAAEMMDIVKRIKERKAGAVFTEPQYPAKTGETLARETRVKLAMLDPVASGPENTPLDYYEKAMKANLETLKRVLGK